MEFRAVTPLYVLLRKTFSLTGKYYAAAQQHFLASREGSARASGTEGGFGAEIQSTFSIYKLFIPIFLIIVTVFHLYVYSPDNHSVYN